jgi:hypothetical protein
LRCAISETRQLFDIGSEFLFSHAELLDLLKVQPELGTGAEEMSKPHRRIPRDRTLTVDDLGDPIRRHLELTRQLRRAHAKYLKLLS